MALGFEELWSQSFGNLAPVGHVLRREHEDRWTRFHALPGSKRYASSEEEKRVILSRAHTLALDMFDDTTAVWLCVWSPSEYAMRHDIPWCFDRIIEKGETESEDWVGAFHARPERWIAGRKDDLLTEIAEDRERAIFFDAGTQRVFAPYDGGFDMIWSDVDEARLARKRHRDWLSIHPEGL